MWRKEYVKTMNRISLVMGAVGAMIIIYMAISTIDVIIHNFNDAENIANWNLFKYSQTMR